MRWNINVIDLTFWKNVYSSEICLQSWFEKFFSKKYSFHSNRTQNIHKLAVFNPPVQAFPTYNFSALKSNDCDRKLTSPQPLFLDVSYWQPRLPTYRCKVELKCCLQFFFAFDNKMQKQRLRQNCRHSTLYGRLATIKTESRETLPPRPRPAIERVQLNYKNEMSEVNVLYWFPLRFISWTSQDAVQFITQPASAGVQVNSCLVINNSSDRISALNVERRMINNRSFWSNLPGVLVPRTKANSRWCHRNWISIPEPKGGEFRTRRWNATEIKINLAVVI